MDRRDTVTVEELGASAFGISVNNMIGKFNELDRLQEIARSAEEDKETAIRLTAENKELRQQIEDLKAKKPPAVKLHDTRNYKMENAAIRTLLQQSNKTIAMLQEKLREKTEQLESYEYGNQTLGTPSQTTAPIVVGDQWKWAGRKGDSITPLYPVSPQMPLGGAQLPYSPYAQDNILSSLGPGGFVIPGTAPPHPTKDQQYTVTEQGTASGIRISFYNY